MLLFSVYTDYNDTYYLHVSFSYSFWDYVNDLQYNHKDKMGTSQIHSYFLYPSKITRCCNMGILNFQIVRSTFKIIILITWVPYIFILHAHLHVYFLCAFLSQKIELHVIKRIPQRIQKSFMVFEIVYVRFSDDSIIK